MERHPQSQSVPRVTLSRSSSAATTRERTEAGGFPTGQQVTCFPFPGHPEPLCFLLTQRVVEGGGMLSKLEAHSSEDLVGLGGIRNKGHATSWLSFPPTNGGWVPGRMGLYSRLSTLQQHVERLKTHCFSLLLTWRFIKLRRPPNPGRLQVWCWSMWTQSSVEMGLCTDPWPVPACNPNP